MEELKFHIPANKIRFNPDIKNKASNRPSLRVGIDIGSTTAKTVVLDDNNQALFTDYRRHDARIRTTISSVLNKVSDTLGDIAITLNITGSAGMGISERLGISFIQEVVASAEVSQKLYPQVKTLLDIGGEDSKLIFFDGRGRSDIRMNGNCAGGTGAFIDQMAVLLGVPCEDLNDIAEQYECIHPIASRCGVFAKTDIQALMSRGISRPDIAASVFNAVAIQTLNTLARGFDPKPKILFTGGPLTFLPMLRKVLINKMGLTRNDVVIPDYPELFPALGAAIAQKSDEPSILISELSNMIENDRPDLSLGEDREAPLFKNTDELSKWKESRFTKVERVTVKSINNRDCFLGIDSGSTTTKMVLIDENGKIALDYYTYSKGDHVKAVQKGLNHFTETLRQNGVNVNIKAASTTGYGEDFIKTVFGLDMGIVETLAHYRAARQLAGNVSFILDIGGQDMKAMFFKNGSINKIEINEACSSGCGTFLQTFAEILNCSVDAFAEQACSSNSPCDLGSRCTVFMNSKVKQFLREGAVVQDMAAGLAYSVVRNCLNKVLKIKDLSELGDNIVVQGGTFLNPSVHRAFEKLIDNRVHCPDIAGLMGAYGCALSVMDHYIQDSSAFNTTLDIRTIGTIGACEKKNIHCNGCSNSCIVTKLQFGNGKTFFSGNRCERIFSNSGRSAVKGFNLPEYKEKLLFERQATPDAPPKFIMGIPRALNTFENYPFWCTLLVNLGIQVELSSHSNQELFEKGSGTVMSDSICFPAKLAHGHIVELMEKGVDRIFYPAVVYERYEQKGFNSYNCPIVTGYPEVIRSSVNPEKKNSIPLDTPTISFKDLSLLKKSCLAYLKQFGIRKREFLPAFDLALKALEEYKQALREKSAGVVDHAMSKNRKVIMIVGRPYHLDRFINHGVPEMLSQLGMDVITEDSVPPEHHLNDIAALTQWELTNRIYNAGKFANANECVEVIQLNSFGCGLDAVSTDLLSDILARSGKNLTMIRIDEIASPGSIKLRLRTLVESLKFENSSSSEKDNRQLKPPLFLDHDKDRMIFVPYFSRFYSPMVESSFQDSGYNFKVLPPPDKESLEIGLKFTNNEICYPAIIVVGDILKAIKNSNRNPDQIAVGITQTGAQCRASNYVTLIKKGLMGAGYNNIPVVTIHMNSETLNEQPGFKYSRMDLLKNGLYALAFADSLSLMYHALLVREKTRGSTWDISRNYLALWNEDNERSPEKVLRLLRKAVKDFNQVPAHKGHYPKIGIVGEIYAKYNDFCNKNVVEWLTKNGVEVEIPCIMNFFTQGFVNFRVDREKNLRKASILSPLSSLIEKKVDKFLKKVDSVLADYNYYQPFPDINDIAEKASHAIDLTHQYGEGWLVAGEILKMAEQGIENILCLQPFGCIANQVVAKGIEKRLRDIYPNLNILFVDLDANTSEANMFNRLHFLVKSARVTMELNTKPESKPLINANER
ncbi:acyl-CoA dehydratase activase-related protein [Thermodesulfobacteriota bacterium]